MTKYIFITGGVVSSLGKGIVAASIGNLLEYRGFNVDFLKFDPYINYDPGTMNPYQHGEVFVTIDGAETDLDLGHYERFTSKITTKYNNYTAGKIYSNVIRKERNGEYEGATVQIIPHITNEIKSHIEQFKDKTDVVIVEIGGTVGDIESLPFLEAIRQFKRDVGRKNVIFIHLALIPFLNTADEFKTKPIQHSVIKLRELGIQPDILICRSNVELPDKIKKKIELFCDVDLEFIISNYDIESIYEVPIQLQNKKLDTIIIKKLGLKLKKLENQEWVDLIEKQKKINNSSTYVTIGIIGKYLCKDAYMSLNEAIVHAGIELNVNIKLDYIDSSENTDKTINICKTLDAIIVPGGFGKRGIEAKLKAIKIARLNKIPFLGICLGMQLAIIEFCRNKIYLPSVDSEEFNQSCENTVIEIIEKDMERPELGGTLRVGSSYYCKLKDTYLAKRYYKESLIEERHRHRFEFNIDYRIILEDNGMIITGESLNSKSVDIVELKDHPFFMGVQFHPEFNSKFTKPHPLFIGLIKAAITYKEK